MYVVSLSQLTTARNTRFSFKAATLNFEIRASQGLPVFQDGILTQVTFQVIFLNFFMWSLECICGISCPLCVCSDSHLGSVKFIALIGCLQCLLSQFLLHLRPSSKEDVVHKSVFQQSQEDKDEAAHQVHVYSFDIGDLRQRFSQVGVDGCHCKHSGDP